MWLNLTNRKYERCVIINNAAVVSQFTLLASTRKGSKPDFHGAASGEVAKELYDLFYARVQELYDPSRVKNGLFKAMMQVGLVNDGPVGVDYRSEDGVVNP
jgi:D-tyrosyl-tRNA(Tyr) deacylase